jgi:hypothetical protein
MSGDRTVVNFRAEERHLDALEEIVEQSDKWGNRSHALRGLIEQAEPGIVGADGGPPKEVDQHQPTNSKLAAVYQAALDAVESNHVLHEDEVGGLATAVTNDSVVGITPDADNIRRYLRDLESEGYARRTFSVASLTEPEGTMKWHIKPSTAVPEEWRHHPDRVTEREQRKEEERLAQLTSPVTETEDSTTVDATAWLAEERESEPEERSA